MAKMSELIGTLAHMAQQNGDLEVYMRCDNNAAFLVHSVVFHKQDIVCDVAYNAPEAGCYILTPPDPVDYPGDNLKASLVKNGLYEVYGYFAAMQEYMCKNNTDSGTDFEAVGRCAKATVEAIALLGLMGVKNNDIN